MDKGFEPFYQLPPAALGTWVGSPKINFHCIVRDHDGMLPRPFLGSEFFDRDNWKKFNLNVAVLRKISELSFD